MTNTSIVGVAQNNAAHGNMVTVTTGPGSYPINTISGTPGSTFDFTTQIPVGAKGNLYTNGVTISVPA